MEKTWQEVWNSYVGMEADKAKAAQIRTDAIATGTWGKQQGYEYKAPVVTVPEEKKTTADKLWDRAAEPLDKTTQAKIKANPA